MVAGEQFNCAASASTVNASKPLRETNSEAADMMRSRASALRSTPRTQSFRATATSLPGAGQTDNKFLLSPRDRFGHMSHRYAQLSAILDDRSARRRCAGLSTL